MGEQGRRDARGDLHQNPQGAGQSRRGLAEEHIDVLFGCGGPHRHCRFRQLHHLSWRHRQPERQTNPRKPDVVPTVCRFVVDRSVHLRHLPEHVIPRHPHVPAPGKGLRQRPAEEAFDWFIVAFRVHSLHDYFLLRRTLHCA